jgi:hypothetical protein
MRLSRDEWKDKARDRADQLREASKSHNRQKQRIEKLTQEIDALKKR